MMFLLIYNAPLLFPEFTPPFLNLFLMLTAAFSFHTWCFIAAVNRFDNIQYTAYKSGAGFSLLNIGYQPISNMLYIPDMIGWLITATFRLFNSQFIVSNVHPSWMGGMGQTVCEEPLTHSKWTWEKQHELLSWEGFLSPVGKTIALNVFEEQGVAKKRKKRKGNNYTEQC